MPLVFTLKIQNCKKLAGALTVNTDTQIKLVVLYITCASEQRSTFVLITYLQGLAHVAGSLQSCQAPQLKGFSRQEYWSCYALLQGIFQTQGSNMLLWHWRQILYC